MAISEEVKAMILRYHFVEKWRVSTIARQLNIHHTTVKRALADTGMTKDNVLSQSSMIEPYLPMILQTLEKYPTLSAQRLYEMARERGYPGGVDHFRHMISLYRPRKHAEAYLRLRTLPAEQAQVDWAHFGSLSTGRAKRSLMAFVMVLSYSRKVFLRFYLSQRMENFLAGHAEALEYFDGVPRVILYDNLKSAVLERRGDAIRFHPTLLEFSAHYRYEPRPVAVARGNEKGRVERIIRFVRENFFVGREWKDLDDLNAQAKSWCDGPASNRPCPEDRTFSVQQAFEQEQPKLIALPVNPYSTHTRETVRVGKTPYVRFDLNDYSVPHQYVRRTLTVIATHQCIAIVDGVNTIAQHPRSYDKGMQIEDPGHIKALISEKRNARQHRGIHYLSKAVPASAALLEKAAEHRYNLGSITSMLLQLLDQYGAKKLNEAVKEALDAGAPHPNSVRLILEKQRDSLGQLPPLPVTLPDNKRVRELVVTPHSLNHYDQLNNGEE